MNRPTPIFFSAVLTFLIGLGVPDGHAETQPEPGNTLLPESLLVTQAESPVFDNPSSKVETRGMMVGANPFPQQSITLPDPPNDLPDVFRQVDAGSSAVCGIMGNRRLMCWGLDDFGQASAPKGTYRQVSVGQLHACAIKTNGRLRCWGEKTGFPTKSGYRGTYRKVSAGDDHTCAIKATGKVFCWGNNDHGELNVPDIKFKDISAKGNHTCGITRDDRLLCWGEDSFVRYVPPSGQFLEVTTGSLHGCATRKDDLGVVCWGNNVYGQTHAVPGQYKMLFSGDFHTCGLRNDNTAICWGSDEHGQLQIPVDTLKSIAAGGQLSCGLFPSGKIWCKGSYAYNPYLFEPATLINADTSSEQVQAQLFPFAFLGSLSAIVGGGMVNYGKGADKKWDGAEARNIKWQLGLAAGSIIFNALSTFLPLPPSKTELLLQDIQAKLDQLEQSLNTVAREVQQISATVSQSSCDQQLSIIQSNIDIILNASRDYKLLLGKVDTLVTASITKQSLIDPIKDIEKFIETRSQDIADARANIGRAMLGLVSTSPIEACRSNSLVKFRQANNIAFDDRELYVNIYRILNLAISTQAMAQMMEQDINVFKASRTLVGPLSSSQTIAPIQLPPEGLAGICAVIRNPTLDQSNPRWALAKTYCDKNTTDVKEQYAEYVAQLEKTGAPYTDDHQILSLHKDIVGYGTSTRNLLWVRNLGDVSVPYEYHAKKDLGRFSRSPGNIDTYFDNGSSREGRWVTAGDEWHDFYASVAKHAEKIGASLSIDFLEKISSTRDSTNKAYFSGITNKPFWMSGQTYDMDWNYLVHGHPAEWRSDVRWDAPTTKNMKCFVASGIGINRSSDPFVSGMVCDKVGMGRMTSYAGVNGTISIIYGKECAGQTSSTYYPYRCFGNGGEFRNVNRPQVPNENYYKYSSELGWYLLRWSDAYLTITNFDDITHNAVFFPDRDSTLSVMPVLDVSKRQCLDSLLVSNAPSRQNFKVATGATIASECGKDLDRVIRDMIPRPDDSIPEYRDLTRYVKALRVN